MGKKAFSMVLQFSALGGTRWLTQCFTGLTSVPTGRHRGDWPVPTDFRPARRALDNNSAPRQVEQAAEPRGRPAVAGLREFQVVAALRGRPAAAPLPEDMVGRVGRWLPARESDVR